MVSTESQLGRRAFSHGEIDYDAIVKVDEGHIHGSVYTDPAIFEDEFDRIWHRGWVYIGHESEVAEVGDYVIRDLGRQPIIISRSADGQVNVLLNRCPHRGNKVVNDPQGNSNNFQCAYHSWTFRNTGDLIGVPHPEGYPGDFEKSELCMAKVPRVGIYRGFVFASLSPEGISLAEHLGPNGIRIIDRVCDISPVGEIEVRAGALRHRMHCNWKMIFENDTDGYHPPFVHAALFKAQSGRRATERNQSRGTIKIQVRDWGNGNAELDIRNMGRAANRPYRSWLPGVELDKVAHIIDAVEKRLGKEHAQQVLCEGPPHATIFPNLFVGQCNIITLQPLGVADTIQSTAPLFYKGAPELDHLILLHAQGGLGPAGLLFADDDEIAERNQMGLQAGAPEWLYLARGLEREEVDSEDGSVFSDSSDETSQRALWKRYRQEMREAPGNGQAHDLVDA
jgi:fatty-acyl-CoA synthase